ncbi:LysE family translocator [Nocardia sp. CDC159]|uniref:LysE family translocator n=1 Tax=Nocardia pulmonis TaxID=2951408 RepID=A0A9X2IWP0_9NOCA|nr:MULTISPECIES: LysE family translocator [Nocardia]MCM6773020.1 LysE family translocator [Nocardia pulmonis]MCM6785677.1 LysE family translocator [Nocardia sp. CDC159]
MISATHFLAFLVASLVIIVIPGPGVLFTIGRALTDGRRAALISVLGHALGVLVTLIFVAAGLGMIVAASALALTIIKFAGALYLVHLGVQAIRERRSLRAALDTKVGHAPHRRIFRQSFIVGISNPKSIVFFSAVLPQFVDRDRGLVPLQLLILGLIFLAIALVSDSAWGLAAGTARDWFARSPKRLEAVGGAGGLMIIGVGASVAVSGTSG